jgi:putative glutathione S-transferase
MSLPMLDTLEARLTGPPLFWRPRPDRNRYPPFVTLMRFDAAYHGLFKTNLRRIADYPACQSLYGAGAALARCAGDGQHRPHQAGYYSIKTLNPTGIVPTGPAHVTALLADVA